MAYREMPGFWGNIGAGLQRGMDAYGQARDRKTMLDREDAQREEAKKMAMLTTLLGQFNAGNANAEDITAQIKSLGFDMPALQPNQPQRTREILASPTGKVERPGANVTSMPGLPGGMSIPSFIIPEKKRDWTSDELRMAGMQTPEQKLIESVQLAIAGRQKAALDGGGRVADTLAGVPDAKRLEVDDRTASMKLLESDANAFTLQQMLADPKGDPTNWATMAYNNFVKAKTADGSMNPAEIETYKPQFFAAANNAKMQQEELGLRRQEIAARFAAIQQGQSESLVPLLNNIIGEMRILEEALGPIYKVSPELALKQRPDLKGIVERYTALRNASDQLRPKAAAMLGVRLEALDTVLAPPPAAGTGTPAAAGGAPAMSNADLTAAKNVLLQMPAAKRQGHLDAKLAKGHITQDDYNKLLQAIK